MLTSMMGAYASWGLKKRCELLKTAVLMFSETENLLKHNSATVYEILTFLSADKRFSGYAFIVKAGELCSGKGYSFGEAWQNAVRNDPPMFAEKSDIELIASAGNFLGRQELEAQLSALGYLKRRLEEDIVTAEENLQGKGKLYRSLGVLSGAFLSVMLM